MRTCMPFCSTQRADRSKGLTWLTSLSVRSQHQDGFVAATFAVGEAQYRDNDAVLLSIDNTDVRLAQHVNKMLPLHAFSLCIMFVCSNCAMLFTHLFATRPTCCQGRSVAHAPENGGSPLTCWALRQVLRRDRLRQEVDEDQVNKSLCVLGMVEGRTPEYVTVRFCLAEDLQAGDPAGTARCASSCKLKFLNLILAYRRLQCPKYNSSPV